MSLRDLYNIERVEALKGPNVSDWLTSNESFADRRTADRGIPSFGDGPLLRRGDVMVSPRAGLVFAPASTTSIYGSYATSHLPSAGDQFALLTDVTRSLKPERFADYEVVRNGTFGTDCRCPQRPTS